MTTQFLLVVVFVFKQESEVTVGDVDNKSCFPLRSKPNYSFLSLPPALPSHRSGCCIQALVLLASHRNLSQIHLNTRPISTQSVVLFQIPYRAFPHFTFLKQKQNQNPTITIKNIYNSQRYSLEPSNWELHNSIISKFSLAVTLHLTAPRFYFIPKTRSLHQADFWIFSNILKRLRSCQEVST